MKLVRKTPGQVRARLLIVEDFVDAREIYAEYLEAEGFRIDQAHNGREALDLLERTPYDLILLDLAMPTMDGWQFLAVLTRFRSTIPVVVVTGHALATVAESVRPFQNVRSFVTKPCMPDALAAEVRRVLDPKVQPRSSQLTPLTSSPPRVPKVNRMSKALAEIVGGACHDLANTLSAAVEDLTVRSKANYKKASSGQPANRLRKAFETLQDLHRFVSGFYRTGQDDGDRVAAADVEAFVVGMVEPLARHVSLAVIVESDAGETSVGALLLKLVVLPLASNSIDELNASGTDRDSIEVRISLSKQVDVLQIVVSDNGPGFGARLDEIRQATHRTRLESSKGESRGYGLVHLSRLVSRLGGSIEFGNNQSSRGATVCVRLPLDV